MKYFKKINEWIALKSVAAMSTIWCVYLFLFWSPLPSLDKGLEQFVFYVSGGIIQLVALPLIMLGQKIEAKAAERRAENDHRAIREIHLDVKRIMDHHGLSQKDG